MIGLLRRERGDLRLQPDDFVGWSRGARFYPFLYMLTRVNHMRDWCTGIELNATLLGKFSSLQLHHIFPKAKLYSAKEYGAHANYSRPEVNALANFTFLTAKCNLSIKDKNPAEYLSEIAASDPKLLEEHCVPMDPDLWQIPRYLDFLRERRKLLAEAGNRLLQDLLHGEMTIPSSAGVETEMGDTAAVQVAESIDSDEELEALIALDDWMVERGLPRGELVYELADDESGEALAVLDLAWPDGFQPGLTQPVALLLDETGETEKAANAAGFLFFTEVEDLQQYVLHMEL